MNNQQSDNDDSSISIDPQQFKKIYEKQKKLFQEKQLRLKRQQQQQRQNHLQKNYNKQTQRQKYRSNRSNNLNNTRQIRQRSRQKYQAEQNVKWHIYENVGQIDYTHTLPEKLRYLPIFKKKDQIISKIIKNQIVLITGDTGCGKSTQVPRLVYQYLKKLIILQTRQYVSNLEDQLQPYQNLQYKSKQMKKSTNQSVIKSV